jgi:hypothetical protein
MTQHELDAFSAGFAAGEMTVAEALALAPDGQVGMVEVRVAPGGVAVEHATYGSPPDTFDDWLVVGYCGAPQSVPSIHVAAVAPSQAFADTTGFHLTCDATPAGG